MRPWSSSVARWFALGASLLGIALAVNASEAAAAEPTEQAKDASLRRLEYLSAEIARHDDLYFRKGQPEISDADYDALKRELLALERRFPPEALKLRPNRRDIGDDRLPPFPKWRHRERMLSLDKTTTESGLREFDRGLRERLGGQSEVVYVVEPKYDGLAISATYEHGRLTRLATRGNGEEGDDVTAAAARIRHLPTTLPVTAAPPPRFMELRGEVYLSFAEFERINRERREAGRPTYASPRNLAAGTLKSLDPADRAARQLDVVFFGMGAWEAAAPPSSESELLGRIREWGLPTVEDARGAASIAEAWDAVQEFGRLRRTLPFPIDGSVIKLDPIAGQRLAGVSDTAPRWAIAFKYPPDRASTRVRGITLQVGRTGVITPVAELEPVTIGGATFARATLHNATELARRDVRIGDYVWVERMGDIIPAITGVDLARRNPGSTPFVFPAVCPACGGTLVRGPAEVAWRCGNPECAGRLCRALEHFTSADGVAIRGLGEATLEALVHGQVVRTIPDLYAVRAEELCEYAGIRVAAANEIVAAIDRSKQAPLWRFISGIGIPGVGRTGAKALGRRFANLTEFAAASENELRQVEGIRPELARSVAVYLQSERTQMLMARLRAAGVNPRGGALVGGALAGKVFALSGALPHLTRARAVELIETTGGRVTENLTATTNYLVAGSDPGAKFRRALELGVPVIDEAQLLAWVDADSAE